MKRLKTSAVYLICALFGAAAMFVAISRLAPPAALKSPSQLQLLVSNLMSICNAGTDKFGDETAYLIAMNNSMEKMMYGMIAPPTGKLDHDFVQMMMPHHQAAIDMAQVYLRFGSNAQLQRIAQEIIVEQQQEVVAMRLARRPRGRSVASTTHHLRSGEACAGFATKLFGTGEDWTGVEEAFISGLGLTATRVSDAKRGEAFTTWLAPSQATLRLRLLRVGRRACGRALRGGDRSARRRSLRRWGVRGRGAW